MNSAKYSTINVVSNNDGKTMTFYDENGRFSHSTYTAHKKNKKKDKSYYRTNAVINSDHRKLTGNNNVLNGDHCSVVGSNNILNGDFCKAKGNNNVLNGDYCKAQGLNNIVAGGKFCKLRDNNGDVIYKYKINKKRKKHNAKYQKYRPAKAQTSSTCAQIHAPPVTPHYTYYSSVNRSRGSPTAPPQKKYFPIVEELDDVKYPDPVEKEKRDYSSFNDLD